MGSIALCLGEDASVKQKAHPWLQQAQQVQQVSSSAWNLMAPNDLAQNYFVKSKRSQVAMDCLDDQLERFHPCQWALI